MVVLVANPILPVITVFDWLYWKHQEVIFLNQCSSISLRNGNSKINSIPLKKVKYFWFYQGDMNPIYDKFADVGIPVIHTLQEEWVILRNYIYEKLTTVSKTISSPFVVDKINKLQILDLVNSCGLKIPQTFIVTDKVTLYSLFKKFQKLLTKPINETVKINTQDTLYYSEAVTLVTSKYIENQAAYFFPTLVQEYVEKQYELRIFYLENRLWATALFTQNDAKTRINQKNYNQDKATRAIPFKLPKIIENKLFLFFKKLNTNTGSVDMIVTPQQEYVFVEVNLNGQFGYYSDVCNYYVEKTIANYLI